LIQNGSESNNGKSNVIVKNIKTTTSGTSNLAYGGAWICQSYFGKGSNNILITDCSSTGIINGPGAGGICGIFTGYSGVILVTNCYSTGIINGPGAGGICGAGFGGGSNGVGTVTNCYSTGKIEATWTGGICGASPGYDSGKAIVSDCYSRGEISGQDSGGICSANAQKTIVTNCYSSGLINGGKSGIYGGLQSSNATSQNCYAANGVWTDSTANTNLTGTPASIPGIGSVWWSSDVNTPYLLSTMIPPQMNITNVVLGAVDLTIDIIGTNLLSATSILLNNSITPASFVINSITPASFVINSDTSITATLADIVGDIYSVKITDALNRSDTFIVNPPIYPICFPAGTPVLTDQGIINIEKINPKIHTINNKKIVAVTKTITNEKHLVCIEKNALGDNIPSQQTIISSSHCVVYKNKFIPARNLKNFVENKEDIYNVKYNNEILYNILMETHETMNVNNMIVETLHPENIFAKLYYGNYSKTDIVVDLDDCMEHKKLKNVKKTLKK
jgi:hypothetical protein